VTRALGPRAPITGSAGAPGWIVLAFCWIPAAVTGLIWAGAKTAAALSGGRVTGYGFTFAGDIAGGHTAAAWPHTPTWAVAACTLMFAGILATLAIAGWAMAGGRIMRAPDDPVGALAAHRRQHTALSLPHTAARATALRASLRGRDPRKVSEDDAGMVLGDLLRPGAPPGPTLYSSWEETETDFMGPRSGKTTARAVPLTLSAPGPVLATSNKPDLWAATAAIRARKGPVWLFDPCRICWQEQDFWVDLLTPVRNVETAHRLASHFVLTVEDPAKRELWGPAAQTLLTALFLAAASSGRTLHNVALWLDQPSMPGPASLLKDAGYVKLASSLTGTQNGAPETRDGIYETARTAAKALRDDDVIRWVTPQDGLPVFSPADFPAGNGTLYLLSESLSYASPLIAAITDLVIRSGIRRAQQSGGRLDPPLPIILDEAANICRIADLPNLYSYMGSHGMCPLTILQSYEQGVTVWGESGMAALWGASTVKLIGAGVDSPKLTREVSDLTGQHDVSVRSIGLGEGRGISENISYRRQPILEAADVRAIPKGSALLLTSGNRPALLRLRNWFTGPLAPRVSADIDRAQDLIRAGASREEAARPPAAAPAAAGGGGETGGRP
jgi:type IV secretory pathway TraG/TraD family ATPase VirD4